MKKRQFGLDLVRTMAIFTVILVHVFLNTSYATSKINGNISFILNFIRDFAFICVPLFIMLTGYCKYNKKINKEHYKGIKKVLISYILISIITVIFDILYLKNSFSIGRHIFGIFNLEIIGYAWYVEMYIGLFLLIPFLNIMYHNIPEKKHKLLFIIIMLFLTSIPFSISGIKIDGTPLDFLPMYWSSLYIFTYYFIGMYIREYQPNINKMINIILIFVLCLIQTIIVYLGSLNTSILEGISINHYSIFTFAISTLTFILLYNIKIKGNFIRKIFEIIANNSFEMYLFSYIFDKVIYKLYPIGNMGINMYCFKCFIINLPLVFMLSLISSIVLNKVIKILSKIMKKIIDNHNKKYLKYEAY